MALSLNSKHTKQFLVGLDPNINVSRHPKSSLDLLGSHHEKLVIIDQKIGFVGGLDLCWGRFDNNTFFPSPKIKKEKNKGGITDIKTKVYYYKKPLDENAIHSKYDRAQTKIEPHCYTNKDIKNEGSKDANVENNFKQINTLPFLQTKIEIISHNRI